jgi:hypothetical protein
VAEQNKTVANDQSVDRFLEGLADPQQRQDSLEIIAMMREVTSFEPKMWGTSIIGFGNYHYRYASGREGDMPIIGFSPRKQNMTLYLTEGFEESGALLERLGKHKTGKSCLYIKRLSDVDRATLRELVERSVEYLRDNAPAGAAAE